jgi:hypothetical protein
MRLMRPRLLALIGLFLAVSMGLGLLKPPADPGPILRPAQAAPAERTMELGLHVKNIYNLSLQDKTFAAEGWFWLTWPPGIQSLIERNNIPLTELVELVNQVEGWDQRLEMDTQQPIRQADGRYLQLYRFSAKFFDGQQALQTFPYEQLELPITIETRPPQFSMADGAVVLNSKQPTSQILGESVDLNGYNLNGVKVTKSVQIYNSSFGNANHTQAGDFSQVSYNVIYRTNAWSAFYRFVLPWLAVMVILLLAPNLEGNLNELRLAIPSTALLTLVFLQEGAHGNLPPLHYLTYLDKLYLFGYVAATVEFWLFVWGSNLISRCEMEQQGPAMARINGVDNAYQLAVISGATCLMVLGLLRA